MNAWAVRMSDGNWVGIWNDKAIAENVCAKQPKGHGDTVVEMVEQPAEMVPKGCVNHRMVAECSVVLMFNSPATAEAFNALLIDARLLAAAQKEGE